MSTATSEQDVLEKENSHVYSSRLVSFTFIAFAFTSSWEVLNKKTKNNVSE
jgi:hypothetical protein